MFEGAIAAFLNRLLGKYVEDLDTEQFNVGIFSGDACLTDLKLKPEALYRLGLPIRVEVGSIGKIVLKIPWSGLFSQPIVLSIEDVYIVAVPATYGPYDAEVQKKLIRAEKKRILEDLMEDEMFRAGLSPELFDSLLASITKNFQITTNNVHIRYEEMLQNKVLCACGVCIQSISVTTTNNKWKPGVCTTNSNTVYQLVRAESLSMYMDHDTETSLPSSVLNWDMSTFLAWKTTMYRALQTFGMRNKEFQFLLKPFTAKVKVIIHKGNETQTSRMLVDIVLQDVAMQVSKEQYITFCQLYDSFMRAVINRPFIKYRPDKSVHDDPSAWWKYACNSVVEHNVRPYTWKNVIEHRKNYRKYKDACLESLVRPNDTELKLDLQKYEDSLTILNIVIAREHAKQELQSKVIERECQNLKSNLSKQEAVECISPTEEKEQILNSENGDRESRRSSCHIITNGSGGKIKLEKLLRPIDYKFNFTLANCCLSFLNNDKEVLVITVTQLLTSVETRSALSAFKVSARAESFVIEGISVEGDLVPLVTVDNILTGNVSTNFLAIDFEKNGQNVDPVFDVSIKLEAIEVTYHHYATTEIINFFKLDNADIQTTMLWAYKMGQHFSRRLLMFIDDVASQVIRINFKIDIKGPYIVFPEYGSIQEGGYILVLDFGNVTISNELQPLNVQLEDATLMELEELLYDRIHMAFSGGQILFCHSGDDWRTARKRKDSEYHFVPKVQANATISYSIKPEYHQLPRTKVNVSISGIKFNVTEGKLRLIMHFLNLLLLVYQRHIEKHEIDFQRCIAKKTWNAMSTCIVDLLKVQRSICLPSVSSMENKFTRITKDLVTNSVPRLDRSVVSSEVSEEDLELLSKTINLSGFDDNVSPCNHINLLLRFAIGELSIHLGCLNNGREEPYLNLRLHTLYLETAIMEYGPAIQFGIGSILLVDKTNAGVTGSYLELISTDEPHEVLVVSYRKVKSNCPDFKSHFKNIERSLIINVLNVNVNLHRPALLKIREFWYNIVDVFDGSPLFKFIEKIFRSILQWKTEDDPPIPPGAIKLNYSARLSALVLRFCDKDSDLLEIQLQGLENDCIYNANERMVLRAHLRNLYVEDLNEETLYSKLLTTDEDRVCDLKYVRHTPRLYACPEIDTNKDDVMSDGTFKLSVGRINCVLISKILQDLKLFLMPFTSTYCLRFKNYVTEKVLEGIEEFKRSATKLHIFIDIQGPIFLLPQRKDSPSLLVLNTGVFSVENFFKKVDQSSQSNKASGNDVNQTIIDNILVKLKNMTLSTAIMTLTRDLEIQEPIVDPIQIHFDIKRRTEYRRAMEFQTYGLFSVQGSLDFVNINLSQRDLKSTVLVWKDNISKLVLPRDALAEEDQATAEERLQRFAQEDAMVKKLQDFLSHNEITVCEINTKLTLEGLQLNLFLDSEEVLSSPVRDLNHGLCKLTFGETIGTCAFYTDRSLKVKLSLQSCVLQDTRKDSQVIKKIIQSPARLIGMNPESHISISMSPIADVTYTRGPAGETCFDALIQEIRINLSVPFVMHLSRYIMEALPGEQIDEGIINHGYESNQQPANRNVSTTERDKLKYTQYVKEEPDSSVSVRIHKPEILLFGNLKANNAHVILLQAEVTIEGSRHVGSSSVVCVLSDVRAKCKSQGNYLRLPPYWLMCPCDIEICRKEEAPDFNAHFSVAINAIDIRLSPGIIHTFIDILNEAYSFLDSMHVKNEDKLLNLDYYTHTNLWTPKKISNVPYKKLNDEDPDFLNECGDKTVTFKLKPVQVCLLIEMEYSIEHLPVIKFDSTVSLIINDWYNNFNLESSIKMQSFCYNMDYKSWEPLIDLCSEDDIKYRPWELTLKMRHGEAFMINSSWTDPCQHIKHESMKTKKRSLRSTDQEATDMVFITPDHVNTPKPSETELYSTYEEDSDTDDDQSHRKLARTSNYLFSNNSSEEEDSDSDDSSTNEDEGLELTPECNVDSFGPIGRESLKSNDLAMYIIITAEDKINFTLTTNTINMINMIIDSFVQAKSGIPLWPTSSIKKLNLHNDIGHASKIEFLVQEQVNDKMTTRVVAVQDFRTSNSPASVPSSPEPENQSAPTSPQWVENEIDFADPTANVVNYGAAIQETFQDDSPMSIYRNITGEILRINFEGFEEVLVYCPKRQGCNLIPLRPARHEVRYHLVIEATIGANLQRTISVRSPLQFHNETSYALGLYYKKSLLNKLGLTYIGEPTNPFDDHIRMAIIEPDSVYSIPLYIAYHFPIHVLPAYLEKYQISEEGIYWKELGTITNAVKDICCKTKTDESQSAVFCVKVSCKELPLSTRPSCQVPNYLITIQPPLVFNNQLPFVIDINIPSISYEVKIEPGERINMHSLSCDSEIQFVFKIQNYLSTYWTGAVKLNTNLERKLVLMSADSESDSVKPFLLCIELCKNTSWNIVIQSQYWIINKSGIPLYLQECHSHLTYDIPEEELMVFSQKSNKKCLVRLRAHQSEWSLPFGLEGITSMSLVVCKDTERGRKYRILTEIESSRLSPHFTKIITFLPYFTVTNKTKRTQRFMEENDQADLWNDLLPGQSIPFWPATESMKMRIKSRNSQLVSQHFDITRIGKTILRMDNGSALCVEIEGGINSPYYVTFQKYIAGDIPVRIDNLCDELFLKISQSNLGQVALVNPFQSLLYTWDDPTKTRELIWNVYNNKRAGYRAEFEKDGCGQETVSFAMVERRDCLVSSSSTTKSLGNSKSSWIEEKSRSTSSDSTNFEEDMKPSKKLENVQKDKTTVYWISYMEGNQRVLLFTQHETVFLKAKTIIDPEPSKREIFCSVAGIGISLLANSSKLSWELMNANIVNSAAHWEVYFGRTWKSLSLELGAWLEHKYVNSFKTAQLDNFIDVDLVKMHMTKPFYGKLRRTYAPGIWLHYRQSVTLSHFHGYMHRIQVDNQMLNATFPVVLYSNLQKCFVNHAGSRKLKHCIEFTSLKQRKINRNVYKGICLIIREFNLNLQEEFLLSLIHLIPKRQETKHSIAAKLRRDVSGIHVTTFSKNTTNSVSKKKDVIEKLYISPILIRLQLLADTVGSNIYNISDVADYRNFIRFIFEYASKGGFEKHAEFRLRCCQMSYLSSDTKELLTTLSRSYIAQIMQQFHVLIRSTTVLGNQYGHNFKSPGADFYEPDTLIMSGDEITERLSHEIALQLGYLTVDAIQASVFNFSSQESQNLHVPSKVKESYILNKDMPPVTSSAVNSFCTEIELDTFSSLNTFINSVHQEELKFFFKTLAKKTSIFFNTESSSLKNHSKVVGDIVRRAQEIGHKCVSRVRLPRYVNPYKGVEVFSNHKAKGMQLLSILNKSHCTESEVYWAHVALTTDRKYIALVSLQRLYFVEKGSTWGSWNVKWSLETNQLLSPPTVVNNKLILHVNENEDSASPMVDWYLESDTPEVLEWLCQKINIAMILNMQNSVCPKQDL